MTSTWQGAADEPAPDLRAVSPDELRIVAANTSVLGNRRATFTALHELRVRGEPRDTFLEFVRAHDSDKWLAYHAMIVLAPDATDDAVWAALERVRDETSDADLLAAVALAQRVRFLQDSYDALPDDQARLEYVLDTFRTGWNPMTQAPTPVDEGTDPQAVWSQRRLRELSERAPQATAETIAAVQPTDLDAGAARAYRHFLAGFLSEAARDRFQALDPAPDHGGG